MSPNPPISTDVVTEKREDTRGEYSANPRRIRSDYRGEEAERKGYAKRLILELLQNVEDALSDDERQGGVLIQFTDGELIVANQGAPFTDRGFRALCTLNDSPKQMGMGTERPRRMIGSKGTGFKSVLNWTDRIELFSGRVAARFDRTEAAVLIRSWIDESGAKKLNEDGPWPEDQMPLLQVPLSVEPDSQIEELLSVRWSTIFRMRILAKKIPEVQEVLANIDPRQFPFLEKLDRIEVNLDGRLTDWRLERREHQESLDATRCFQLYISKDSLPVAHYQVMRRLLPDSVRPTKSDEVGVAEIGFAFQVDGNDDERNARVANFFATDCLSPFPAIAVHGTFLLKADRSHLAEDDRSYQHTLADALCNLLRERLIPDLVSQYGPGALNYLAPRTSNSISESDGIEAELQQRLVDEVKSTAFVRTVAGPVTAPRDLRLWDHKLGKLFEAGPLAVAMPGLPHPHWCNDDTKVILRNLGANTLTPREHIEALQGWVPQSTDAACDAFSLLDSAYHSIPAKYDWREVEEEKKHFIQRARRLTIWRVAPGGYRALTRANDAGTLFEPRKDRLTLPKFVRVSWLDFEFQESLKEKSLWDSQVARVLREGQLHKGGRNELLEHAVLVSLQDSPDWWEANGYDLLLALRKLECESDPSDIYESKLREQLGDRCRVPTRYDGWQMAARVYAGGDWDNPWAESFVARSDGQRFLLAAPDRLPEGKNIPPVLRFIGVSWAPKWRRHLDESDDHRNWPKEYGSLATPPDEFSGVDGWPSYWHMVGCKALEEDNQRVGTGGVGRWPLVKAWAIEGLEEFIGGFEGVTAGVTALRDLWESKEHLSRRRIVIGRRGPNGAKIKKINQFESLPEGGFIAWQIKSARLLSVQPSPLFPDGKAALSDLLIGTGQNDPWLKWLPRLSLTGCDPREAHDLENFVRDFGGKAKVGDYSLEQWRGWLSNLPRWRFDEPPIKEARSLLHALSQRDERSPNWADSTQLPCETADEALVFCSVRELTILDEPRFEVFKPALLKAGHRILHASVNDGRRLLERFGCKERAVSTLVRLDVAEYQPCPSAQERLRWCERVRQLVLAWLAHAGGRKAAERLRAVWPREIRAHNPLQVNVVLSTGGDLERTSQPFLWEDDILHVDAGDGHRWRLWEYIAAAFEQRSDCNHPVKHGMSRLFDVIETEDSADVGRQFLADDGLGDEELRAWEDSGPRGDDSVLTPGQSSLPQPDMIPNFGPNADAIINTPVATYPPKAPSTAPNERIDDLPKAQPITPRHPPQYPISGSPTHRVSPTQAPWATATVHPETGSAPAPTPAASDTTNISPPSRPRGQEPQRQGQEAEAWLYARLADLLEGTFEIKPHHRDDVGETDLVIFADGMETLHIEVKLMTKRSIYWSFGEILKAQSCATHNIPYALAILIPDRNEVPDAEAGDLCFQVKWITEPVSRLARQWIEGRVRGEWRWTKMKVPAQTLQTLPAWTPSTPPTAEAQSITYVIEPGDGDYVAEGLDYVLSLIKAKQPPG